MLLECDTLIVSSFIRLEWLKIVVAKSDKALRTYIRAVMVVLTSPVMKNKNVSSISEDFKVRLELCINISKVQ